MRSWAGLILIVVAMAAPARAGSGTPAGRPLLVTVDDLPMGSGSLHTAAAERERITIALLGVLARHRVRAVGFVVWGNVRGEADERLLERWLESGHELGNHSKGHLDLTRTSAADFTADVEAGRLGLAGLLGRFGTTPRFFRFPYLREGNTEEKLDAVRAYLASSGQRNVPVTIDDQDWSFEKRWVEAEKAGDRAAMAAVGEEYRLALRSEILAQTALGDELFARAVPQVLLLHANAVGAAQWDALFTWLQEQGFRLAAADEVLADPAFAEPHRFVGERGCSLWYRLAHERQAEKARTEVVSLLQAQAAAWSRGDLESFCEVYADDAAFVSPSGLTRGRDEVLARYRKRYSSPELMGTLTLQPLELREAWGTEVTVLGDAVPSRTHGVSVVARWTIRKADGSEATGLTLLVLHRIGGAWRIVQDASM